MVFGGVWGKSIICDLYSFLYSGFHGPFLCYEGDAALLARVTLRCDSYACKYVRSSFWSLVCEMLVNFI